jgi:hypothetical protein
MSNNNLLSVAFISGLIILYFNCGMQTCGVETTNGASVVASQDKVEGTAPPLSSIYLFTSDYIPYIDTGLGVSTVSDLDGYYSFNNIEVNAFNVTVIDSDNSRAAVISGRRDTNIKTKLEKPGSLEGSVVSSKGGPILVFLYGTGYYTILENEGSFLLNSLPGGQYKIQAARIQKQPYPLKPIMEALSEVQQVTVEPEKKTMVPVLSIN